MFEVILAVLSVFAVLRQPSTFSLVLIIGVILGKFGLTYIRYYMDFQIRPLLDGENLPKKNEFKDMTLLPEFKKGWIRDILISLMDLAVSVASVSYLVILFIITIIRRQFLPSLVFVPLYFLIFKMNFKMLFASMRKAPTFSVKATVKECTPGRMTQLAKPFGEGSDMGIDLVTEGDYYDIEYDGKIYQVFKQEDEKAIPIKKGDEVVLYSLDGEKIEVVLNK